jgi:hypothetical protein
MKILPFTFLAIFLMAIFGIHLYYKMIRLLKEKHGGAWEELGRPELLSNNSIGNNLKVLKFLKNRQYTQLNDQELNKISQTVCNYSILYLVFFITAVVIFLVNI